MNETETIQRFIYKLHAKSGADDAVIMREQTSLGILFPSDYIEFLHLSNGAYGLVGQSYVSLWSVEKLAINNKGYEVTKYAPGLLLFGSDGGDTAYAFDTRENSMVIVEVPFIGMNLDEVRYLANTFINFLSILNQKVYDEE